MSARAYAAVWHESRAKGVTRLVFLALAEHANPDGVCWPSIERVAEMCRMSERTVQRALHSIERSGEMERTYRHGHYSTLYQIRLPTCGKPEARGDAGVTPGVTHSAQRGDKSRTRIGEPNTEPRGPTDFPPVDPDAPVHIAHIREHNLAGSKP